MKSRFGEIGEFFKKNNSVPSATLRRLGDESLAWVLSHMVFEISHFVWEQERVRHKLVVDGEEPLESRNNNAENVLFGKVVHQRVAVKNAFAHLDNIQVVVSQSHSVPEDAPITWLGGFPISILADDVLNRIQLAPAVIGVNNNLGSPEFRLLFPVHDMILMDVIIRLLLQSIRMVLVVASLTEVV